MKMLSRRGFLSAGIAGAVLIAAMPAVAAVPTLQDFTQYRGALTRKAAGGVPLSDIMLVTTGGFPITAYTVTQLTGTAGHWTTANGLNSPVPSTAGVLVGLNGGPYTFSVTATNSNGDVSAAKTLTIPATRADTYTVSAVADVSGTSSTQALKAIKSALGGKFIEIARGSDAAWFGSNQDTYNPPAFLVKDYTGHGINTRVTFQNEDDANPAVLGKISVLGSLRVDFIRPKVQGYIKTYTLRPPPVPPHSYADDQIVPLVEVIVNTTTNIQCDSITFVEPLVGAPVGTDVSQWMVGFVISGKISGTGPFPPTTNITLTSPRCERVFSGFRPKSVVNFTMTDFVVDRFSSNAWFMAGEANTNVVVQRGIMCRPFSNPSDPGDHRDNFQTGINGVHSDWNNILFEDIWFINADGDGNAQGMFFNDVGATGYNINNTTCRRIFYDGAASQGFDLDHGSGWLVEWCTTIRGDNRVAADNSWHTPKLNATSGTPGVVNGVIQKSIWYDKTTNILPAIYSSDNLDLTLAFGAPAGVTTVASCAAQLAAYYTANNIFLNPDLTDLDYASMTPEAIVAAYRLRYAPTVSGPCNRGDNTFFGLLMPDGTDNQGQVYGLTPPTTISSSAQSSSMVVGQTNTITFQLNAAANLTTTITPVLAGVTGTFSAATVVIAVGDITGTVDFTATSDGTASITCTNNRSLVNPAALLITVTTPPVDPTSFTQSLTASAAVINTGVQITYTLNRAATRDVTITPAVANISGNFSSPTVTVPFGALSATVVFVGTLLGIGSLTATDDAGLTDPAAAALKIILSPPGNRLRMVH